MGNMSAVETLQAIRANFAALQAELDEARAENARLKEGINGLSKKALQYENDREYNASLVMERDARIAELEAELDAADACAIAQDGRIAELEAARRWVPVGERLPAPGQTVYGWVHPHSYIPGNGKEVTYMPMLNPDYPWRSTWDMATYSALDITHWQPLPAAPEASNAR